MLEWKSVRRVDLLCEEHPKCPICLEENMVVPKVTKCGHVFCAPCVMRFFMTLQDYNGKLWQRCPVCNEMITADEWTSVRLQMVRPLREGDQVDFVLAQRDIESTAVRLNWRGDVFRDDDDAANDNAESGLSLPLECERGWHLGRLLLLGPGEADRLLAQEIEALKLYRPHAITAGDTELLPSIDSAVSLLQRHQRERQKDRNLGDIGSVDLGDIAANVAGWGCCYVEVPKIVAGACRNDSGLSLAGRSLGESCGLDRGAAELQLPASQVPLQAAEDSDEMSDDQLESAVASPELGAMSSPDPSAAREGGGRDGPRGRIFSHYQLSDGRLVFLEPFFTRLLLHEHGGRWDGLPITVRVRLERLQELTVADDVRRRHKFLSHLPLGAQVTLVDVDLRGHLSRETREQFAEEFAKRRQLRKRDQLKEKKEERLSKSRAAVEEEKYYKSLNLMHPSVVQAPPTKDDFAVDLHGRELSTGGGPDEAEAAATAADADAADGEEGAGPTFAERIRDSQTRKAGKAKGKARQARDAGYAGSGDTASFPELAPSSSTGGSTWGKGTGSSRAALAATAAKTASPSTQHVPDSWEDDEESPKQSSKQEAQGDQYGGDQTSFGEALESALRRSVGDTLARPSAGAVASDELVAAVEDEPAAVEDVSAGKKKKGRAAKGTTLRLFG
jgi:hypothetical protein